MRLFQSAPTLCLLLVFASCQQISVIPNQAAADDAGAVGRRSRALAVFEKRILPIFQAKNPSSCTECLEITGRHVNNR